jgi:chromate transporter
VRKIEAIYEKTSSCEKTSCGQTSPTTTIWGLAGVFASVGMTAFGGGVCAHLLHHLLKKGWLSESTYLEALNWSQCIPGCNGTNISTYLGWRLKGAAGAILSTLTLVLPGLGVIMLASRFLTSIPQPIVHEILQSVVAVAVGLLLAMTWKLAAPIKSDRLQLLIIAIIFILVGLFRVPIPVVLVPVAIVSWYLCNYERPT